MKNRPGDNMVRIDSAERKILKMKLLFTFYLKLTLFFCFFFFFYHQAELTDAIHVSEMALYEHCLKTECVNVPPCPC